MNDNKIWINQSLLFHKDTKYNTDSNIDISLVSSTTDLKNFSPPALNIALSSFSTRKNQMLNIQNTINIKKFLDEYIYPKIDTQDEKVFKIQPDKLLIIGKKTYMSDNCYFIKIKHSETDIISIAVDENIIETILYIMSSFIENYIKLSIDISSRFLLSEILNGTNGVKDSVLTIPSSIIDSVGSNGIILTEQVNEPPEEKVRVIEELTKNLDDFLGKDMDNISLDIPEQKEIVKMVTQPTTFIDKPFPTLRDFESFIFSIVTSENVFKEITTRFNYLKDGNFLPGITSSDLKSYFYISKTMYMYHLRQYMDLDVELPTSLPIIKYIGRGSEENIFLAYDLLTINLYIRLFRSRIELKDSNNMNNGSLFYLALRSFTDILIFSFIENIDKSMISTNIIERFKYLQGKNFFNEYDLMLKKYNMKIDENDIKQLGLEMFDKVLGKTVPIGNLHDQYFRKELLNIPYDNPFTSDDILMKIVPLQLMYFSDNEISKEILEKHSDGLSKTSEHLLFKYFGNEDMVQQPKHNSKDSNIVKTIKNFLEEIPFNYREQFIDKIQGIKDNIDLREIGYPYEELGENILKAIYVWNEYDKKISYEQFRQFIDSLPLQKTDILIKIKSLNNDTLIEDDKDNWFVE